MAAKTVISFVGKQGTGKTTIAKKVAKNLDSIHVETSDIVAEAFNDIPRKDLTVTRKKTQEDPNWLGLAVYKKVIPLFEVVDSNAVILSGVREMEVHRYLSRRQVKLVIIEIISDPIIRCNRLLKLGTIKSVEHFINQDLEERKMGLDEVTETARFQVRTSDDSSPSKLAKAIVTKLVKEGHRLR